MIEIGAAVSVPQFGVAGIVVAIEPGWIIVDCRTGDEPRCFRPDQCVRII